MYEDKRSLESTYRAKETHELIALSLQDLTPVARDVLNSELNIRGVDSKELDTLKESVIAQDKRENSDKRRLAPLSKRVLAQFIDSFILLVIIILMDGGLKVTSGFLSDYVFSIGFALLLSYLWLADGLPKGQSVGKQVMKIAVIHKHTGKPCNFRRSLLRNITLTLLNIFDWLWVFSEKRQRLGDLMANTIVINVKKDSHETQ